MFSYNPLKKLLIDRNIKTNIQLMEICSISKSTATKINKDEYIDMQSLDKICSSLNCNIEDVIEHIKD